MITDSLVIIHTFAVPLKSSFYHKLYLCVSYDSYHTDHFPKRHSLISLVLDMDCSL